MTQLVELQQALPKFEAAGIRLYAVSYDTVTELAEFARHHGITYPLLSDKGSKVIRRYGILNHFVTPDEVPYHGIPFPGTYLVDERGVVQAKFFRRNLAMRESAESMIDGALGEILLGDDEPSARGGDDDIRVSATYHGGGGNMKSAVVRNVVVRFELAGGLHIYDDPVPQGMVATRITVSGPEGIRSEAVRKPVTHALRLPGLEQELRVWDGRVDFVVPVWADDRAISIFEDVAGREIELVVKVDYQACDDRACRIPRSETLRVLVPVAPVVAHGLAGRLDGVVNSTMNTRALMIRKIARSLWRSPIKGLRSLIRNVNEVARGPAASRRSGRGPGEPGG